MANPFRLSLVTRAALRVAIFVEARARTTLTATNARWASPTACWPETLCFIAGQLPIDNVSQFREGTGSHPFSRASRPRMPHSATHCCHSIASTRSWTTVVPRNYGWRASALPRVVHVAAQRYQQLELRDHRPRVSEWRDMRML